MRKNKLLLLLVLLMTAATGAWADETPLTTITPTGKDTYSETTAGVVTVTPSNMRRYSGDYGWLWKESGSVTVEAKEGYTITKCVFKQNDKDPVTITTSPFAITFDGSGDCVQNDAMDGVTSIEVYGAAAASGYTVSLKDGVKDADKWTISPNPAEEGQTVTLQYTGRLKVKGVTATSDEKPAEASVPDGAINGKFSVSSTKKVYFSKGNLRYASSKWSFFDNQYDYYTSYSADAWDHFGWSTSATTYGMSTSSSNGDYSGDFVDWGATMGAGWRTLTSDEWAYLLKTRSASTVNGTENGRYAKAKVNDVGGVILFPDTYTHPDGVAAPTGVNATDEYGWEGNSYTAADWTKMESAGCVFLPAAGCRYGSEMIGLGSYGYYGSATPDGADYAYRVKFNSGSLEPANSINRCLGCSVRLVQEATSDEKPAAWDGTITAQLAAKLAYTRGDATDDLTTMTWAVGEHIAILYKVSGTKKVADAEITAVDGTTGAATITFKVEDGTPDNTACTLVYPYSAAKDDHTGVKDAATLLAAQDGTLSANLDVRVGAGTIQTTTPGLTVTTQPAAQFAIFKFTTKNANGSATIDVTKLTITIGAQNYVITPASATSELYVALPAVADQAVRFSATGSDSKTYTCSKASVTFAAGKYYQSMLKMALPITVTWNNNDITGSGNSFSKGGVTLTAGSIDFDDKSFEENGTFTTTLGNFTKIEVVVTNGFCDVSGTGWSGNSDKRTWTGNASSVSFIGDIYGDGNGIKFVFTIEP